MSHHPSHRPSRHTSDRPASRRSSRGGRHELGQNHLHDPRAVARIVDLARASTGPILEIGPGSGALTGPLLELGRPLTVVEIDEHRVADLRQRWPDLDVRHADATRLPVPPPTRVVVGNLPFHVTTPLLRSLLRAPHWRTGVLLVQWEVARKRAAVGGATLMTAQSAPWFSTRLDLRVPARAFRPVPSVDAGVLCLERRPDPLVPMRQRAAYEQLCRGIFSGRGRGLRQVLLRAGVPARVADAWLATSGCRATDLPRDVPPEAWAVLWNRLRSPHAT